MKTAIATIVMLLTLLIITTTKPAKAALIDDFNTRQQTTDTGGNNLASYSLQSLDNASMGTITRELIAYAPVGYRNLTQTIIDHGRFNLSNRINNNQPVSNSASIRYTFNNFNAHDIDGFYLEVPDFNGDGLIALSTNGPSGFSYSNFHRLADHHLDIPLAEFHGAKLFNNLTELRVDFIDVPSLDSRLALGTTAATVPLPATAWLFLAGLLAWLKVVSLPEARR
jgi:hypothetical protein